MMMMMIIVYTCTGRGNADVSENDFVDKMMHRLEGRGSSLTSSVKSDADWESFKISSFSQKVNCLVPYLSALMSVALEFYFILRMASSPYCLASWL